MSTNLTLFDDLGTLWDGGSPRLRQSFGSPASNDEFSTYVVKNMGFVAVHSYGRSCEIRLRPQFVSAAAFDSLQHWVNDRKFDRIVIAQYDTDWAYGLYVSKEAALAKVEEAVAKGRLPRPADFLTKVLVKDDLPRTTAMHQAIHSLIENWPLLSQSVHRDGLSNIIRSSLQGRYHVMHAGNHSRSLTFGEIGSGFVSYSENWRLQSVGRAIAEHEDAKYGQFVAESCHAALIDGRPTICDVDAVINTPKIGRARVRYKRIFLPSRSIGGGVWMLTSSILDPTIDLRVNLLDKTG